MFNMLYAGVPQGSAFGANRSKDSKYSDLFILSQGNLSCHMAEWSVGGKKKENEESKS